MSVAGWNLKTYITHERTIFAKMARSKLPNAQVKLTYYLWARHPPPRFFKTAMRAGPEHKTVSLSPSVLRLPALTHYPAPKNAKNYYSPLMAIDNGSRSPSRSRSFSQQVSAIAARLGRVVVEDGHVPRPSFETESPPACKCPGSD